MGFGVTGIQKCKKFLPTIYFFFFFFFAFLIIHYGFTYCFEILTFGWNTKFQPLKYWPSKINTSRNIKLQKSYKSTLNPNFGVFIVTLLTLKRNLTKPIQDIKLKFSGLSYLIYCNNLAFFQILWWVMSKSQKFCTIWCGMTQMLS